MSGLAVCPLSALAHLCLLPVLRGTQANDIQIPWGQKTGGTEGKALCGGSDVLLPSSEYLGGSGDPAWLKKMVLFSRPW